MFPLEKSMLSLLVCWRQYSRSGKIIQATHVRIFIYTNFDITVLFPLIEYVVNTSTANDTILNALWSLEETITEHLINQTQEFWNERLERYFLKKAPFTVMLSCFPIMFLTRS